MEGGPLILVYIVAGILALALGIVAVIHLFKAIVWLFKQIFRFIFGEIGDLCRIIGAIVTAIIFVPLVVANIIVGRWSASAHFGRGITHEFKTIGGCVYRIAVGHPARLLCLHGLTEGIEKRLPQMVAEAPGADKPRGRAGQFEGYTIVGSLPGGGSGGKLYIAEPDEIKSAAFARSGIRDVGQVVIKSFSLDDGSSLPQIVRESRALDAAKKLGLILDHDLSPDRFYYVMRFVPGQSLTTVTRQLHSMSGPDGLANPQLRVVLGYTADLLSTLDDYHRGGLWHKDVKPDNIIVDASRATLVDFGLVTPLRSAMTLTTHGTEYFRDPELVRLALKGVKVHEVDGTKFDIYGAGAVLYSMIEDSFPAHGVLSPINKRCPEALRWVVRRAMADYDKRYASVGEMLGDLRIVMSANDPFAVRPVDLPSMRGQTAEPEPVAAAQPRYSAPPPPPPPPDPAPVAAAGKPNIRVVNWWTGAGSVHPGAAAEPPPIPAGVQAAAARAADAGMAAAAAALGAVGNAVKSGRVVHIGPEGKRRSAIEQIERARARVQAARDRAAARLAARRSPSRPYGNGVAGGVLVAVFIFMGALVGGGVLVFSSLKEAPSAIAQTVSPRQGGARVVVVNPPDPPQIELANGTQRAPIVNASDTRTPAPAEQKVRGRVLVVSDLLPPYSKTVSSRIGGAVERMTRSGLTLIGNVPGEAPAAESTQLLAEVCNARQALPLDAKELPDRIGTWLMEHQDDADAVLWIGAKPEGQSDEINFYIFSAHGKHSDVVAAVKKAAERTPR